MVYLLYMTQGAAHRTKHAKRTLVMFSGGIDSTAALWHVLQDPKRYGEVHVHHIHIQNIEARWRAEATAVEAVLAYMREHVPTKFTTSESAINTPSFGNKFLYDAEIMSFMTGYMTSRDPLITKVVIGATGTDFTMTASAAVARGKKIHNAFYTDDADHSAAVKEYPLVSHTKEEVYKMLPPELAALTWSCRTPRYVKGKPVECGRCKTCVLEMRGIRRPTSGTENVR